MQRSEKFENGVPSYLKTRSSIWDKWGVAGVTRIAEDLSRADITVNHSKGAAYQVAQWALKHEHGHADVADDLLDEVGYDEPFEAADLLRNYDKWQNEVEAWTRNDQPVTSMAVGELILDCLNSYRRGLKIDDEEWEEARELIADMANNEVVRDHLRSYEPLEPYDDEPPPSCGSGPSLDPEDGLRPPEDGNGDEDQTEPEDDGESGSEEDDGEEAGGSEEDGEDDEGGQINEAKPDDGQYDPEKDRGGHGGSQNFQTKATLEGIWNDPATIRELQTGRSLESVAAELDVPVSTATPLARAIASKS